MSIFSTKTIKASKGRSLYKYKNSPVRIAQEATYTTTDCSNDIKFVDSLDNIFIKFNNLEEEKNRILKVAMQKHAVSEIEKLVSMGEYILANKDNIPDDIIIPNARKYRNMDIDGTGDTGLHSIVHMINKEMEQLNNNMINISKLLKSYKVEESKLIIKELISNYTTGEHFGEVLFLNHFSTPVEVSKDDIIEYIEDFLYLSKNFCKIIDKSYSYLIYSFKDFYNNFRIKRDIYDISSDREDVKELLDTIISHMQSIYDGMIKYLYTYHIALEERYDVDISVIKYVYAAMNNEIDATSMEDYSMDDEINYGRFLGEASIINEADEPNKVKTYLVKIANGIRAAWNKLNQKLDDGRKKITEKFGNKLDELDNKFDGLDPQFKITNYPNYDFTKLGNIKVIPLRYNEMKDSLKSENDFIKKYYPNIPHEEKSNFKDDITKFVTTSKQDLQVTADTLHNMMKFIRADYNTYRENVQADIEVMNKSNEEIDTIAKNTSNQVNNQNSIKVDTKQDTAVQNSAILYGNIVTEADDKATTIEDNPGRTAANSTSASDNSFLKDISVYSKVSTLIISTKMKILKDHYMLSINTIIHASTPPKKNKEETKTEEK